MTTDDQAFLHAIRADLDNDVPRLVYADWLDDHGDEARAEFIRIECELAHADETTQRYRDLEDRRHELLSLHEEQWLGDLDECSEWFFRRGFVDEVLIRQNGPTLDSAAEHPIRSLTFEATLEDLEGSIVHAHTPLNSTTWPTPITELDLSRLDLITPAEMKPFFDRWDGRDYKTLILPYCGEADDLARALADTPLARTLHRLNVGTAQTATGDARRLNVTALLHALRDSPLAALTLASVQLSDEDMIALHEHAPRSLKELVISYNSIAPFAYNAFNRPNSLTLTSLNLSGTPLGVFRLREVLHSLACRTLTELSLNHTGSARPNLEALIGSPFWTQAESLHLRNSTVPTIALEHLCENVGPRRLRTLDLGNNFVRTEGVKLLAAAPWTKSLTWLALDRDYIDDKAAPHLAEGFPELRTLHLNGNNFEQDHSDEVLTHHGIAALADAPNLKNLRLLNIAQTHITDATVEAIMNSPHWSLSGLGLSGCDLSPRSLEILASSPQLARLDWLDLSGCANLRGSTLQVLAESPYLSPLCELNLRSNRLDPITRATLEERLGQRLTC